MPTHIPNGGEQDNSVPPGEVLDAFEAAVSGFEHVCSHIERTMRHIGNDEQDRAEREAALPEIDKQFPQAL